MTTIAAVQLFVVIHLTATGLSHILAHQAWAEFFIGLRDRGRPGVIVIGMMSLAFGSIIAAFHPIWSGLPVVVTLLGWSQVAKGVIYLSFPDYGLKKLEIVSLERSRMFIIPGVGLLLIAALTAWILVAG